MLESSNGLSLLNRHENRLIRASIPIILCSRRLLHTHAQMNAQKHLYFWFSRVIPCARIILFLLFHMMMIMMLGGKKGKQNIDILITNIIQLNTSGGG